MAPWLELPYEIKNVTAEEDKLIKKCLMGYKKPFVKCGKLGYVMPGSYRKCADEIYNFQVRPDDVWVITFPRSGTTWTQELVWLLKNNLDYDTSKEIPLFDRFPMLELTAQIPTIAYELIKANFMNLASFQGLEKGVRCPSWKSLDKQPSPRYIKTHLPLSLLPPNLLKTAKVIYVARDPRDVAVSYYYLHKMIAKSMMRASFKTFWSAFKKDLLPWTPLISHTNEAWTQRNNGNLHFVFYEDMLKDLPKEIDRISKFLDKDYSEKQIEVLSEYLSFKNLQQNNKVNNTIDVKKGGIQFMRKGEAGGWKTHFDEEMEAEADEYITSRLSGLDLTYPSFSMENEEWTHL